MFTLRSDSGKYRSLLLFRLSNLDDGRNVSGGNHNHDGGDPLAYTSTSKKPALYAMESECPHLGADLSHAEIEDSGDDVVAVCPWHR